MIRAVEPWCSRHANVIRSLFLKAERHGKIWDRPFWTNSDHHIGRLSQWRKCRTPVKTIAMPCRFATSMVSASFTEPPG